MQRVSATELRAWVCAHCASLDGVARATPDGRMGVRIVLAGDDGAEARLSCESLAAQIRQHPVSADWKALAQRYVAATLGVTLAQRAQGTASLPFPTSWEAVRERLVQRLERARGATYAGMVYERIGYHSDLVVNVVIDSPERMQTVGPQHAAHWGVDEATIFTTALANLRALTAAGPGFAQAGPFLVLETDDGYAAARLLVPDVLRTRLPTAYRDAALCVAVPRRDLLLAVPVATDARAALAFARLVVGQQAPYPLSPLPVIWDGNVLVANHTVQVA